MRVATNPAHAAITFDSVSRCVRAGLTGCSASARALDRVSLVVRHDDIVLLTGRRGSGKTALLQCAAGVMTPDSGRVTWAGSATPPCGLALAGARDLRHAAPTVGECIEESIAHAHQAVWSIDSLVTRTMARAGLKLPRITSLSDVAPPDRTRIRIARAIARASAPASASASAHPGGLRCLLIDGSADDEPLALRGDDLRSLANQLGCAIIAAADSLGIDGCVVPRTVVLELGRVVADIRHLVPPPQRAPRAVAAPRAPVLADVDPLPALL